MLYDIFYTTREGLKKMRKALVIIDMQKAFIKEKTKHLPSKLKAYIDKHGEEFDAIVATAYINNKNTACYRFENWTDCMAGSEGAELIPEVVESAERIFCKDKYSCWNKEFKKWVSENHFDKLYFCGISTACCVLHSAFDAYNDLQDCCVIEDLCGSTRGEGTQRAAIQILGECITTERIIQSGV